MFTRTVVQRETGAKPSSAPRQTHQAARAFSPAQAEGSIATRLGRAQNVGHSFREINVSAHGMRAGATGRMLRNQPLAAHGAQTSAPQAASGSAAERRWLQHSAAGASMSSSQARGAGARHTGLPHKLKVGLEKLSGLDLSGVRVHYNSDEPSRLQAFAHTQGNDIHLGPGQEQHLPHEGWHVVQQRRGRVQSTKQMKGLPVNDNASLEREADVMGAHALSVGGSANNEAVSARPASNTNSSPTQPVYQCQPWKKKLAKLGLGYGAFIANNLYQQSNIKKYPEKYKKEKGRLKAVYETSKGKPGQAAYAMHLPVSLFHMFAGNIGSSNIGEHYEKDIPDKLSGPDTNQNLEDIGSHETEKFWKKQTGLPYYMGNVIGAQKRADILKQSRDFRKKWQF